jgi:hypothetical protein
MSTSISNIIAVTNSPNVVTPAAAAQEEANETPADTVAEAARGDQQAIRRLAKMQQQQRQPATPAPTSEPAAGEIVNYTA